MKYVAGFLPDLILHGALRLVGSIVSIRRYRHLYKLMNIPGTYFRHAAGTAAFIFSCSTPSFADTIRVAVASNFLHTMQTLKILYEKESRDQLVLSAASTGKLFAQINHGAPYDVFLAADNQRPARLLDSGLAVAKTNFIYAIGRLTLWSAADKNNDADCKALLTEGKHGRLAIANPKTAPYGKASVEVIEILGLSKRLRGHMARGESIGQTFHYIKTGNADLGFVARSQLIRLERIPGCYWHVPESMHTALIQGAILLKRARNYDRAKHFLAFLESHRARQIIKADGYSLTAGQAR